MLKLKFENEPSSLNYGFFHKLHLCLNNLDGQAQVDKKYFRNKDRYPKG